MEPLKLQLTPVQSEILKSVALLLLLCHHLFYIPTNLFEDFSVAGIHDIVNKTAMACKACVPFFVFLSGYGLAASAERTGIVDIKRFFMRRFTKLYLNYWLVWLIFVPVGVLFFGISFESVYGHEHTAAGLVADFLGLLNITGAYGYNPTWWFYSCIILLYVLFPFIFVLCRKPIAVHLMFWGSIALTFCPLVWLQPIRYYILAFLLGIYFRNGLMASITPMQQVDKQSNT
jgi:peptidoglycan/LPS O-acetylase OafA/YrhL